MSKRIRTTLTLDDEVVNRAKELGINLSAAAERGIIDYIKEIENIRSKRTKVSNNDDFYENKELKLRRGGDLNPRLPVKNLILYLLTRFFLILDAPVGNIR